MATNTHATDYTGKTDVDLMLLVREGNLEAYETLFQRYSKPLLNFFFRMSWDPNIGEDFLQEVFLRLWVHARSYQPTGKFSTYIFQIAKNLWLNEREKRIRRPGKISLIEESKTGSNLFHPMDDRDEPARTALRSELEQTIHDAIETLPEKLRMVFVLCEHQDLKYEDVADILNIPVATVKSRMFKASRMLQDKLGQYMEK